MNTDLRNEFEKYFFKLMNNSVYGIILLGIEMKKTKATMNKPVYLGMAILDISKILMYEFWHDCIKLKYGDRAKLILTALYPILKLKTVLKIMLMILKDGLIHLTMIKTIKDRF